MATATQLKGVYRLNPSKMITKQGSRESRAALTRSPNAKNSVKRPVKGKTK